MSSDDGIAKHARTVSSFTLVSRVLGLARDAALVRIFGDTAVGSAFNAAFALPNVFRRLFGEGALSAAVVPVYADLQQKDAPERGAYVRSMILIVALVTGLLTGLVEAGLAILLAVLPPDPVRDLSLELMILAMPFMPLVCLSATIGGMLQVHGRFSPSSAAPIILNLAVLGIAIYRIAAHPDTPAESASWVTLAVVGAGLLQVAWAMAELAKRTQLWGRLDGARQQLRRTVVAFLPAVIGMGTLQLSTVIDITIAMWPNWFGGQMWGRPVPLDEASNAVLSFTQRLYQFPLGVFGIAIATAAFPALAKVASDPDRFGKTLTRGIVLSSFIAIPATIGLLLVGPDLTRVMFTGGIEGATGFSQDGVSRANTVLMFYVMGLTAYSFNQILVRAFHAQGDTSTPMRLGLLMLLVNLGLNLVLIWPLREAGLAAGTAIGAIVQCCLLWWLLARKRIFEWRPVASQIARHLGAGILMGVFVFVAVHLMPAEQWTGHLVRLIAATLLGVVVYASLTWKLPERLWLMRGDSSGSD